MLIIAHVNFLYSIKSSLKPGTAKVFYSLCSNYDAVALVGLPKEDTGYDELEEINEKKESIRIAAAGKLMDHDILWKNF